MSQSVYPNELDSDLELSRVDDNLTEIGGDAINSLRDAVFAIETAIGINPQGNLANLVNRINGVIDENGNLKASALEDLGLVTLPINDAQIGDDAGIKESKLDLDYPTATLNGRISNFNLDIDALRTTISASVNQNTLHFIGLGDRHDGYQIDLTIPIRTGEDVETVLNLVNNAFTAHEGLASNAHTASSISINNEFQNISADTVQDALIELDNLEVIGLTKNLGEMKNSSVTLSNKGEQGKQGNLKETVLASTIFQTDTLAATNILQVMRPNVARITSSNADLRVLEIGAAQNLRIQAGGIDRDPIDIDLSSIIPTDDIDELVELINTDCVASHYPVSAYNTSGRLTIAHNIPGKKFTIQIGSSVSLSAHDALGFGDVVDDTIEWADNNNSVFIDGHRLTDAKSLIKIRYIHDASPLDTIIPELGDLSLLGLTIGNAGRILCNITNHDTDSTANGTYYIVSFPDSESFVLSEDISLGEFDLEIPADAVNFNNSTDGEIHDIFIEADEDGYYVITEALRVSYSVLTGVSMRAVNEDFTTDSLDWKVTDASTIQFIGSLDGETVTIPSGFIGQLKVYGPDGISNALFEVTGAPASGTESLTISEFEGSDTKLYISSIHYAGNFGISTLKFVTDRRKFGGTVKNFTDDKFKKDDLEQVIDDLKSNGVVRGLDLISNTTSILTIRGGKAYIDGRAVEIETQEITVSDFTEDTKLLLLDRYSNFIIKSDSDPGYSFEELIEGDSYGDNRGFATILAFDTDGSVISGNIEDRRLLIGNLDKRLVDNVRDLNANIAQIQSVVSGSFWGNLDAYQDDSVATLSLANNPGLTTIDEDGFAGGNNLITTRRFEFKGIDSLPHLQAIRVFATPGLTHINIMGEVEYTGASTGPFGTSGEFSLEFGVEVIIGRDSPQTYEDYVSVKTIDNDVLPSGSVIERYVASIPVSLLSISANGFFSAYPRVRIVNSTSADGGGGADSSPVINFSDMRVVTSSYSVAGNILDEDGTSQSLATTIDDVL